MADLLKIMRCGCKYDVNGTGKFEIVEDIFGDGNCGDCTFEYNSCTCGNVFLPVGDYCFDNLTICEGVKLRFCGEGTPIIRVKNNFVNDGCIILRNPLVCCNYTLYEPLLGLNLTTTKNDCYDCALTTYNCIYDRVGTPCGGAGGGGTNGGGAGGQAGCSGCDGDGGCGGIGGTSEYMNAGGGGGGGGGTSASCPANQGCPGCPSPEPGVGGRGGNGASASGYCPAESSAGGGGGGGGYGYLQGGDGGDGGTQRVQIGGYYCTCLTRGGGDGGDSYMGKGGNGGYGTYVSDTASSWSGSRGRGGNGGWSYYGNGGTGGHGGNDFGNGGNGGWSMFGNGGNAGGTSGCGQYIGGSSIYGNAGNGKTKGNGLTGGAIARGGAYGLGLFAKKFNLSGQIWGPGGSGSTINSKSANIYIVTGREYVCNGCICNTGGSCNGKLVLCNTSY